MKNCKKSSYLWKKVLMILGIVTLLTSHQQIQVFAASGTVYTSSITRCYRHPVTGNIEDSGGESGYATGQGMVEGCVGSSGLLEVTDTGEYYLTFRMSLMDYTTDHSFLVQNVGDSGWKEMALGQTGSGTDSSGTTADVCVQVPSENCIVRISMYVTAMGRNVVFYIYPSNYQQGNQTSFKATMVTESTSASTNTSASSGSTTTSSSTAADSNKTSSSTASSSGSTSTATDSNKTSSSTASSSEDSTSVSTKSDSSSTTVIEDQSKEETADDTDNSTAKNDDVKSTETSDLASILDQADGLSLSTDSENMESSATTVETAKTGLSAGMIVLIAAAVTVTGVILMWNMAAIVYLFRKNWYRWGGGEDDEEE